MIFKYV